MLTRRKVLGLGFLSGILARSQALTPGSTTPPNTAYTSPGATFTNNRTAIVDSLGRIGTVQGDVGDCVLVGGTASPCATGPGSGNLAGNETPAQVSTLVYTLAHIPNPGSLLQIYLNGVLMAQGVDYSLTSNTVTFISAWSTLLAEPATMLAFYQY